jgi:hypothetical protein
MCRNIKTLFNFDPPATPEEVRAASVQFVRKFSGFTSPSKANEAAFDLAVDEVTDVAQRLLDSLVTSSAPRDREAVAAKARERATKLFAPVAWTVGCCNAFRRTTLSTPDAAS